MKAVIASGGTGGHFYPGFALGQALRARGHEVLFLVRKGDPSLGPLEKEGFPSAEADLKGLPRGLKALDPRFAWRTWSGFRLIGRVLDAWRPDAVVGMGAYLSLPAVWGAWRRGIPALIHESNAKLGLAHRLSLPFVDQIALGLPIKGFADPRARLVGTPVRPAFNVLPDRAEARRRLGLHPEKQLVVVMGGSQGAQALNSAAAGAAALFARRRPGRLQVLHLAGPRDYERTAGLYRGLDLEAKVLPYLETAHEAFAAADLAVCRSGASTLAELIAARKPAVLVPFPSAAGGHQLDNAKVLADAGAAVLAEEKALTPDSLFEILDNLIVSNGERLKALRSAYETLDVPDPRQALPRLAALVESLAGR